MKLELDGNYTTKVMQIATILLIDGDYALVDVDGETFRYTLDGKVTSSEDDNYDLVLASSWY